MIRPRVAVIGGGNVGLSVVQELLWQRQARVYLYDLRNDFIRGRTLDLKQSSPLFGREFSLEVAEKWEDLTDVEIFVLTAGRTRQPGMSRLGLLEENGKIIRSLVEKIRQIAPQAYLVVVTNPVDVLTTLAYRLSGFPRERILGMGGILDSARMVHFISEQTGLNNSAIQCMVIGEHGESMLPLPEYVTVAGLPLSHFLSQKDIDSLIERTRNAGAEIVGLLQAGSAALAPGVAAAKLVSCLLGEKKELLPASVYLQGEYGIVDCALGVPVMLGPSGVEQIVEVKLSSEQKQILRKSAENVQSALQKILPAVEPA